MSDTAVVLSSLAVAAPRETSYLVALLEASCGTCPRKGRALLGAMVRDEVLSRPYSGSIGRGRRFDEAATEAAR